MKAQIRIATEMYCYIEPTIEGTPEEIVEKYHEFQRLVKPQNGLTTKEFNDFVDSYLSGNLNGLLPKYEAMNESQKTIVQTIKRSLARIKSRMDK